jgi:hypothetical protein
MQSGKHHRNAQQCPIQIKRGVVSYFARIEMLLSMRAEAYAMPTIRLSFCVTFCKHMLLSIVTDVD